MVVSSHQPPICRKECKWNRISHSRQQALNECKASTLMSHTYRRIFCTRSSVAEGSWRRNQKIQLFGRNLGQSNRLGFLSVGRVANEDLMMTKIQMSRKSTSVILYSIIGISRWLFMASWPRGSGSITTACMSSMKRMPRVTDVRSSTSSTEKSSKSNQLSRFHYSNSWA